MAPESFGHRFLTEFQRLGGSTSSWPPAAVEALEQADRRRFIDVLKRASPQTGSSLTIAAHTAEPETLARKFIVSGDGNITAATLAFILAGS